jgi:hypothetical protein
MVILFSTLVTLALASDPAVTDSQGPDVSCQTICSSLPDCASSMQGSYCKSGAPSVCYGLYLQNDGNICYYQTNLQCDQSVPVICGTFNNGTTSEPTSTEPQLPVSSVTEILPTEMISTPKSHSTSQFTTSQVNQSDGL